MKKIIINNNVKDLIIICIGVFLLNCIINIFSHKPILSSFPALSAVLTGFGIVWIIAGKKDSKSNKEK